MMKRLFVAFWVCTMAKGYVMADQQYKVKLDNQGDSDTTIVVGSNIQMHVSMDKVEFAPTSKVNLRIYNNTPDNDDRLLIVSGFDYAESELKAQRPRISYYKKFPGTKGSRRMEVYAGLKDYNGERGERYIIINPLEEMGGFSEEVQKKDTLEWRIPIYIARHGKVLKKRLKLIEKLVIQLDITSEIKPNEDYSELNEACDLLIQEINDTVICSHKRHNPSADVVIKSYEDKITELKEQLKSTAFSYSSCDDFREYGDSLFESLLTRLNSINLQTRLTDNCGKHKAVAVRNRCKYCNMSYNEIFNRLDDCYLNLDNGDVAKDEILEEVNALYRCCTLHANRGRGNWNDYKGQIEKVYQSIINF